ncbi:hypothetical protein PSPO01_08997 [Paraphaeosphaeria sporulosa]
MAGESSGRLSARYGQPQRRVGGNKRPAEAGEQRFKGAGAGPASRAIDSTSESCWLLAAGWRTRLRCRLLCEWQAGWVRRAGVSERRTPWRGAHQWTRRGELQAHRCSRTLTGSLHCERKGAQSAQRRHRAFVVHLRHLHGQGPWRSAANGVLDALNSATASARGLGVGWLHSSLPARPSANFPHTKTVAMEHPTRPGDHALRKSNPAAASDRPATQQRTRATAHKTVQEMDVAHGEQNTLWWAQLRDQRRSLSSTFSTDAWVGLHALHAPTTALACPPGQVTLFWFGSGNPGNPRMRRMVQLALSLALGPGAQLHHEGAVDTHLVHVTCALTDPSLEPFQNMPTKAGGSTVPTSAPSALG